MTLTAILGSIVLVAIIETIREIVKKIRSRGEKDSENLTQMRSVVAEYVELVKFHKQTASDTNDAYQRLKVNLNEASAKVVELENKVHSLEIALMDAQTLIDRLFEMKTIPR